MILNSLEFKLSYRGLWHVCYKDVLSSVNGQSLNKFKNWMNNTKVDKIM